MGRHTIDRITLRVGLTANRHPSSRAGSITTPRLRGVGWLTGATGPANYRTGRCRWHDSLHRAPSPPPPPPPPGNADNVVPSRFRTSTTGPARRPAASDPVSARHFRLPDIPEKHPDDMTGFRRPAAHGNVGNIAQYLGNPDAIIASGERYIAPGPSHNARECNARECRSLSRLPWTRRVLRHTKAHFVGLEVGRSQSTGRGLLVSGRGLLVSAVSRTDFLHYQNSG